MKMRLDSPKFRKTFFRVGPALLGLSFTAMSLTSCTTGEGVVAGALAGAAVGGVIGHANEHHDRQRYYRGGPYDHGYYHNDYYYQGRPSYRGRSSYQGRSYYPDNYHDGRRVYYRPGRYGY